MIIPRPIRRGDTIGVTAPSAGVTDPLDLVRMLSAVSNLGARGYRVRATPNCFTSDEDGRSSPAEEKVRQIRSLLEDDSVTAIVSAKGGDYQHETIRLIDWDAVTDNPKWFQGYSDNTVLGFKATVEHDIATVYAGNFGDYGMIPWHRSIEDNLAVLEGRNPVQRSYPFHEDGFHDRVTGTEAVADDSPTVWRCTEDDAVIEGRLVGGCMDVLDWYVRTGNCDPAGFVEEYSGEGLIWFMETYDMDRDRVGRMFRLMAEKGWFKGVAGFVFGRPLFYRGGDYVEDVSGMLSSYGVPLLFDADVGHRAPRMTLVNGAPAELRFSGGGCSLAMRLRGGKNNPPTSKSVRL